MPPWLPMLLSMGNNQQQEHPRVPPSAGITIFEKLSGPRRTSPSLALEDQKPPDQAHAAILEPPAAEGPPPSVGM